MTMTHEAKSQGYDILRFGNIVLWESNNWKEIKESINGKSD